MTSRTLSGRRRRRLVYVGSGRITCVLSGSHGSELHSARPFFPRLLIPQRVPLSHLKRHAMQHADGWGQVNIECPPGQTVAEVVFASWGDWTVECDGGIKCEASKDTCNGAGCNGGTSCACPCKGFVSTDVCSSCSWSTGDCSGASAQDFVEKACLGKDKCGPFPANNGNDYDGAGKGDPCSGKAKHLGIAVRCCPASGCPILSEWGAQVLVFVFVVAGAYFGGGGVYRFHKLGARGADLLPHKAFWAELRGLVEDGVAFAQAGGKRRARSGSDKGGLYSAVPAAAAGGEEKGGRRSGKDRDRSRGRGSAGASSKEKRKERDKKCSGERVDKVDRAERGVAAVPAPAPNPAPTASPSTSTASGGGGRWVHVPN